MSAIDNRPDNMNFLSPLNFKFQLKRAPALNFFIQKVNIPGLSLPSVDVPTSIINIPYPGDHLLYNDLTVSFKVDENLENYLEIHNWLRSLGRLDSYQALASQPTYTGNGLTSDVSLMLLTSYKNPNYEVIFENAFPISLSGLDFITTAEDVDYLEAEAVFKYVKYDIKKIV